MTFLRGILKIGAFAVAAVLYLAISFVGQLFIRDPKARRHFFTDLVSIFCRWGIWLMNIEVKVKNLPPRERNFLFVGNHLGILDIVVLASVHPTLFITSVEMRETPGLGLLCEMGGCLFVERRSRSNIQKEIEQIREALRQGLCVTLYPEGTSSNGERLLPFKKSLLTAAAGIDVPIRPLVINYRSVNGEPMSDKWRDFVCWYGDQTFPPALWRMMTMRSCVAELEFLEEVHVRSHEERREVAALLQARISEKFTPIPKAQ
jgi:1-acyl-sn-glycerol-3-phosphate acyltransferase